MLRTVTDEVYTQSNDDVQLFNDRIAKGHRVSISQQYVYFHRCNQTSFVFLKLELFILLKGVLTFGDNV